MASKQEPRGTAEMIASVIRSMQSHIAVIDSRGCVMLVNDAWRRFCGAGGLHSLEKISVGANYLDICRRFAALEEQAGEVLRRLEAILSGSLQEFRLEYRHPLPHVERWFVLSATPLQMDGGGAVIEHTDITERVAAEQQLKGSEEHYRALIENEVDVVTILDQEGVIRFESPALQRILGYAPEELIGKNSFDFLHPADLPMVKQELARVLSTKEPSPPVEYRFRHKNGSWRVLESVARNLLTNPAVTGIIVNSRDITERREAEAELQRKDAALVRSHEQLQALTGRLLEAEEFERRRISRELHDDLIQKLAILAVDLGALAKSVSESHLSGLQKELRSIQKRVARVSDDVRTMAYQLHPSILDDLGLAVALRSYCSEFSQREKILVRFVHRNMSSPISPELASCIYRITQEALRNIAKHAKVKDATVSLVKLKGHINLTVRDEGVGFGSEAMKPRRGLGLTSMAERARLVGGEFNLVSAPGKGTTVRLRVPLAEKLT